LPLSCVGNEEALKLAAAVNIADVARLVGEPGRADMLVALLDGRALTATELAAVADITRSTASTHLTRLTEGGLLRKTTQGRHRYFRLAGPLVAAMLEGILVVAAGADPRRRAPVPRIDPALRAARTCYDHLAGRLGVGLADALIGQGALALTPEAGEVTEAGQELLASFGIATCAPRQSRRLYCRPCLDWSERRCHIAGVLGAALLQRCLELGWIDRAMEGRIVTVTAKGRRGFAHSFGFEFPADANATLAAASIAAECRRVR
jgi:DNA-binding transcriptional ArsR family regulator